MWYNVLHRITEVLRQYKGLGPKCELSKLRQNLDEVLLDRGVVPTLEI